MSNAARPYDRGDLAILGALTLAWACWAWRFWFVLDDAYISLRYSQHWGSGLGIRYNLGDHVPVEGYSNFLMVAWGALLERLGLDLVTWVPVLSVVAVGLLNVWVYDVVRRLQSERWIAGLSAATVGLSAIGGVWSTSGLETGVYALCLFATVERLVIRAQGIDAPRGALWALATALCRFEGILWMGVIAVLTAVSRHMRGQEVARPLGRWLAMVLVPYGLYTLWRWQHFGMWLPSTAHAKVGFSWAVLERGCVYVLLQVLTSLSLLVVLPGVYSATRASRRPIGVVILALALGFPLYAALVGGDFMTFSRFLVPMVPLAAVVGAWVLTDIRASCGTPGAVLAGVVWFACAHAPGWNLHLVPESVRQGLHFRANRDVSHFRSEYEQWARQVDSAAQWSVRGRALAVVSRPGDTIVMSAIGAAGYYSGLFVFDRHGFVNTEVSTRPREALRADELKSPGHDDPVDDAFFLDRGHRPTFLFGRLRYGVRSRKLAKQVMMQRQRLVEQGLEASYAVDFWPVVGASEAESGKTLLVVWRRIDHPEDGWPVYERKLASLTRGEPLEQIDIARGRLIPAPE